MRPAILFAALPLLAIIGTSAPAADTVNRVRGVGGYISSGFEPVTVFGPAAIGPPKATADHPLFRSPYCGDTGKVIAITRHGNITEQDLYLWILVRYSNTPAYIYDLYRKARMPKEREELGKLLREEIKDYVFTNFVIPGLVKEKPSDEIGNLKAYLYSLPGYQLAYLQKVLRPRVCIQPADRQKYLQEHQAWIVPAERWRIRYILLKTSPEDSGSSMSDAEDRLDGIRNRILAKEISFAEAAKQFSEAPSAANGGEIPPFAKGELFTLLEHETSLLEPGGLSRPFPGPGGVYLVQLLEKVAAEKPSLDNPTQAKKVEEGLFCQAMKGTFDFEVKDLLLHRKPILRNVPWDDRSMEDVVGEVGGFKLSKCVFQALLPEIEDEELQRRDKLVETYLRNILEREAMAQEVREAGLEADPLVARARQMGVNMMLRDHYAECLAQGLKASEPVVKEFWKNNPHLFTPLAMKHVVKLTLTPANTAPLPEQTLEELASVLEDLEAGRTPTGGSALPQLDPAQQAKIIAQIDGNLVTGAQEQPAAVEQTTSVVDAIETSATQAAKADAEADEKKADGKAQGDGSKQLVLEGDDSCTPPRNGPGPAHAELKDPAVHPWFAIQERPDCLIEDERAPAMPPLPLNSYRKRAPSQLGKPVAKYQSPDWVLSSEDMGFLYIVDRNEIPPAVDKVPVGSASSPVLHGASAVSYYIEDSRRPAKPPFDEIKTRAYSAYRQVRVRDKLKSAWDRGISGSGLGYRF